MTVPAAKVCRILNLTNEAHDIADSETKLQHLFSGVCNLVGADTSALFVFNLPDSAAPQAGFLYGYSRERAPAVLAEYSEHGDTFDLMAQRLRAAYDDKEPVFARRRQDLIDDHTWYNSTYVNEFRRRWGFDHSIYSIQRLGEIRVGLSVNRCFGATPFNLEDQALIEIFHLAIARVVSDFTPGIATSGNDSTRARLAPRVRETLDCLLRGTSNKDAAEQLHLSTNTVHHYCKLIFRAFDVGSRSELLAKWFSSR